MQDGLRNFISLYRQQIYYVNLQLRYEDKFSDVDEVRKGLFECMDRMLDYQERLKADIQLDSYDQEWVNLEAELQLILED